MPTLRRMFCMGVYAYASRLLYDDRGSKILQVAENEMHHFSGFACIQGHIHVSIRVDMHVATYVGIPI